MPLFLDETEEGFLVFSEDREHFKLLYRLVQPATDTHVLADGLPKPDNYEWRPFIDNGEVYIDSKILTKSHPLCFFNSKKRTWETNQFQNAEHLAFNGYLLYYFDSNEPASDDEFHLFWTRVRCDVEPFFSLNGDVCY